MKIFDLHTTVKWQETDKRNVLDVRNKIINDIVFPSGLILEIGCAAGNFFNFLSVYNRNYIGIDLDLNQIEKAKKTFPSGKFIYGNIFNFDDLLKSCRTIVSFQVIEHIENDFALFNKINSGKNIIFSVPNFPYRNNFPDGHKRYYELDGWIERYKDILDINEVWTIKHYKKNRKIFVFQCTRR
jgi:2-polyprenyl-3-methyl-5-hydroxy-6-metoxy-1,4-benzoquinol methylase